MKFLFLADMWRTTFILLFCLAGSSTATAAAATHCMPFGSERMLFSVGWEFINAGTADMRIESSDKGYRVTSYANSNSFLDAFKMVRDIIISEGDCVDGKLQSTLFSVEQNEGTYHSQKQVHFLWKENRVTHTQNGQTDSYQVPAGHLNAIDAFFRVRKMDLKPGMKIRIPIFDSRKQYEVEVDVIKREKLFAPWGKPVDCLVIIPRLKTEGIFSSKGTVKLWLSDDARHIPLKMTAKIKFGRIVATLNNYSDGQNQ
ncbi:MAG: DUF3108 domain-containing protein [Zetaproteobacteria bacterium CG12_big_fil_rev_8_21_14_0_65_55_1124]|nr:MAG: DUF3108 domain-containing protein [Zetaproteobacteria bacterium CG08_land_8_20_14_0_20_55_17]PIW42288.1 MAG: DUF3108 domain-containing protein [Zetaproteobacteria bacterium CG12_big_fil_rev_8_21_14_0_65_55_1124]PIY52525.1 MAG: DUF3108 domain-containing protein [Zetaproteobacteria bacterium CG_4_10_14_0_8_um_filter_55_43]PIZ36899.1 MAG: DUF3108 domain-containing protein [Zetaproteobacteria bacterium CG_4_10_14_0_2_um_filter_55_20]PJB80057.1 MAG: DUF3108 domain-containing protein [Zetapro